MRAYYSKKLAETMVITKSGNKFLVETKTNGGAVTLVLSKTALVELTSKYGMEKVGAL